MNRLKITFLAAIFLYLYFPILVIIGYSFNVSEHSMLWHGFTWHWYEVLFHDRDLAIIAAHSFSIAILAATFATTLGTTAAICLDRYQFWGRKFINQLLLVLIIIPDLVLGIAFLLGFTFTHFPLGFWSLLIAHIGIGFPFACITVKSRLSSFDQNLIEAGRDLGANELTITRKILIPLLMPGIIAAWLISLTLSLDDVIISYFVTGPNFEILPLKIYSMVRLGVKPEVNALCTILLGITLVVAIMGQKLTNKKS